MHCAYPLWTDSGRPTRDKRASAPYVRFAPIADLRPRWTRCGQDAEIGYAFGDPGEAARMLLVQYKIVNLANREAPKASAEGSCGWAAGKPHQLQQSLPP